MGVDDGGKVVQDLVPVWLKKGTMTLPKDAQTPLIMVGPGTGVAAFRSFIQ
jgi:sulfite reductase alpha subunit-like flavoprotein